MSYFFALTADRLRQDLSLPICRSLSLFLSLSLSLSLSIPPLCLCHSPSLSVSVSVCMPLFFIILSISLLLTPRRHFVCLSVCFDFLILSSNPLSVSDIPLVPFTLRPSSFDHFCHQFSSVFTIQFASYVDLTAAEERATSNRNSYLPDWLNYKRSSRRLLLHGVTRINHHEY